MLIPTLRAVKEPMTHLLVYAAPVTKMMMQFNSLNYYSLPSLPRNWKPPLWLTVELGLFSGRLYFGFDEYITVLNYLGQTSQEEMNGFKDYNVAIVQKNSSGGEEVPKYFSNEPLNFFQDWLTVRRKGQDISYTPVGYVCQGRLLTREHPFFVSAKFVRLPENSNGTIVDKMRQVGAKELDYKRARTSCAKAVEVHRDVEDEDDAVSYSDDYSAESEDNLNYDDAENADDGDFDEHGGQSSEDSSNESIK